MLGLDGAITFKFEKLENDFLFYKRELKTLQQLELGSVLLSAVNDLCITVRNA